MKPFYSYQFEDLIVLQTPNLWNTYRNYNYILCKDKKAWVIDPGEFFPIEKTISQNGLQVESIILTHHHPDHVGATNELAKKYNCEVVGFKEDQERLPPLTKTYSADEEILLAGYQATALFLPGHTLGLCAFYIKELNLLFSNDLIFSLGCGRVFEGTYEQMFESLKKVRDLPDDTLLFCSHEYTEQNLKFGRSLFPEDKKLKAIEPVILAKRAQEIPTVPTTLGFEKQHNPFLRWDDPEIRKFMELENAEDSQVFAEIRRLKDIF